MTETSSNGRRATIQRDDCRLALLQDVADPPETQLIFRQGDLDGIVRHLTAKGLPFERGSAEEDGGGIRVLMRDPDGHAICFVSTPR